jgi:hypothetical protein
LLKSKLFRLILVLLVAGVLTAWLYLNRPLYSDMAGFAPSDASAFVEVNDLLDVASHIEETTAWKSLAAPIGARSSLVPNVWLIRLARWTGIGSADAILLARSQVALIITGAEASEAGSTLTIKPLATIVIETHTSQRRMRPALERHLEEFARRFYQQPSMVRKQMAGVDLTVWTSVDGTRKIIAAFLDTAAIIGNDEQSILHSVEARTGKRPTLSGTAQFQSFRSTLGTDRSALFGFVSKSGVKSLLQGYALYRGSSSADVATVSQIFADSVGSLIDGLAWTSRFVDDMFEDRCTIKLADGVADQLRMNLTPTGSLDLSDLPFVPANAYSISLYRFRDLQGAWRDLNLAVSSHADFLGALAARPLFQSMLQSYGIRDQELFVRSAGPRIQTVRLQEDSTSVLITEAFDRPGLQKLAQQRLGPKMRTESSSDEQILLSDTDNWAMTFVNNYFLSAPADELRSCVAVKSTTQSLTSTEGYRKAEELVDVSLPIVALTFTRDDQAAISFVELFSEQPRSTFSTNAANVDQMVKHLPYAVSVTILKDSGLEWTSRSSFGLLGSLLIKLTPEKQR